MIITKLTAQKRDEQRVNIFVDDVYRFSLTVQQVADLGLKKGAEIDEAELKRLKRESSYGKLYIRALRHALSRPHSQREMMEYVRRVARQKYEDLDEVAYTAIIEALVQRHYIDDETFARHWSEMRQRQRRSVKAIRFELAQKGVDDAITQRVLPADDAAALQELVEKKRSRYKTDERLIRYLISKGFRYDDIRRVL